MVINCMFHHGYLPDSVMETVIIPIVKSKKGDISSMENYRPIAITTIISKVIELLILDKYSSLFSTHDNQFGFKSNHGTDLCIFALQQVIEYYRSLNRPIYICYMDASKAFDRVNYWCLFKKLLHRDVPKMIVRLILYWYTSQQFCVQWNTFTSDMFYVGNGVRQGGILSPSLFNIYIDDLCANLSDTKTGCNINGVFINHLMYADDSVLIAPSPVALQKLIDCCSAFATEHSMVFNVNKTVCMYIRSKLFKDLSVSTFYINGNPIKYVHMETYLGFIMNNLSKHDHDIVKQSKSIYCRGNMLISNFKNCNIPIKIQLHKTY